MTKEEHISEHRQRYCRYSDILGAAYQKAPRRDIAL